MARTRIMLLFAWLLCSIAFVVSPQYGEAAVEGRGCSPEPTDMVISYGDLVNCRIDSIGDTDVFRFSGTAGEVIIVQVSQQSGGTPCIELFGPDGVPTPHGDQVCFALKRIDETLEQDGDYTILVSEFFNNHTVEYGLVLERVSPPSPTATPLCFDCNLSEGLNGIGDLDLYLFTGVPGDIVRVQGPRQSGGTPCIELFGPDGVHTPHGDQLCSTSSLIGINETLEQDGVHTILVSEFFNNQTVEYRVNVQCVSGECPPPPGLALTGPTPGLVGTFNTLDVSGATPGEMVFFVHGFQRGSTEVPGCFGVTVDILDPKLDGSTVADAGGHAILSGFVPNKANGQTVLLQAVEHSSCTVSNLVMPLFP
ncbi:MAG: hypothetical protein HY347_07270 [candidate division NC10 bacterium]|nr:hypothetical protein [candidate division NC10 bacterium]